VGVLLLSSNELLVFFLFLSTTESSDAHTVADFAAWQTRSLERSLEDAAGYKGGMFLILKLLLFPTWNIQEPGAPQESAH